MKVLAGPLGQLLGAIYGFVGHYAFSIIIFTIIVKLLLFPLTLKQLKSTKEMAEIQPKIKEMQEKYKNDKETLNIKTMELYKEHKINPLGGCLPLLIQMPILFGLFAVLRDPILYVFTTPELKTAGELAMNSPFLWMPNLVDPDSLANIIKGGAFFSKLPGLMPIIAAVLTYVQMKTMSSGQSQSNDQMKMMNNMMPFMILWFGTQMSGGLVLYWAVSTLFQLVQQIMISRNKKEEVK